MAYNTKTETKLLLLKDYLTSLEDLGDWALRMMPVYDSISYELVLVNATSEGKKVTGTAVSTDYNMLLDLVNQYQIQGDYFIRVIDSQKEFFLLLAEIRDDLKGE